MSYSMFLTGVGNRRIFPRPRDGCLGYDYNTFDLDTSRFDFDDDIGSSSLPRYYAMGTWVIICVRNKTNRRIYVSLNCICRCSYRNTEFVGYEVGGRKGISSGSVINCKRACQNSVSCDFYTYRRGGGRDCYLKRGRRG